MMWMLFFLPAAVCFTIYEVMKKKDLEESSLKKLLSALT